MPNGPSAQCKASQEFYIAAARAYVDSGNPHNQLAVLATYVDRDLDAVYHYCRALTTRIPFEVARDNVRRLELKIQERAQTSHAKVAEILKEKTPNPKKLNQLICLRFLQFHAMIRCTNNDEAGQFTRGLVTDLSNVTSTVRELLSKCYQHSTIQHGIILKMFVISIFTVHETLRIQRDDEIIQLAWEFVGMLVKRVCNCVAGDITLSMSEQRPSRGGSSRSVFTRDMLRPAVIIAKWTTTLFCRADNSEDAQSHPWISCPDTVQRTIVESILSVINFSYLKLRLPSHGSSSTSEGLLPEEIELLGFVPISTSGHPPTTIHQGAIKEPRATAVRVARLQECGALMVQRGKGESPRRCVYIVQEKTGEFSSREARKTKGTKSTKSTKSKKSKKSKKAKEVKVPALKMKSARSKIKARIDVVNAEDLVSEQDATNGFSSSPSGVNDDGTSAMEVMVDDGEDVWPSISGDHQKNVTQAEWGPRRGPREAGNIGGGGSSVGVAGGGEGGGENEGEGEGGVREVFFSVPSPLLPQEADDSDEEDEIMLVKPSPSPSAAPIQNYYFNATAPVPPGYNNQGVRQHPVYTQAPPPGYLHAPPPGYLHAPPPGYSQPSHHHYYNLPPQPQQNVAHPVFDASAFNPMMPSEEELLADLASIVRDVQSDTWGK